MISRVASMAVLLLVVASLAAPVVVAEETEIGDDGDPIGGTIDDLITCTKAAYLVFCAVDYAREKL